MSYFLRSGEVQATRAGAVPAATCMHGQLRHWRHMVVGPCLCRGLLNRRHSWHRLVQALCHRRQQRGRHKCNLLRPRVLVPDWPCLAPRSESPSILASLALPPSLHLRRCILWPQPIRLLIWQQHVKIVRRPSRTLRLLWRQATRRQASAMGIGWMESERRTRRGRVAERAQERVRLRWRERERVDDGTGEIEGSQPRQSRRKKPTFELAHFLPRTISENVFAGTPARCSVTAILMSIMQSCN